MQTPLTRSLPPPPPATGQEADPLCRKQTPSQQADTRMQTYGEEAGGRYPTGMHPCSNQMLVLSELVKSSIKRSPFVGSVMSLLLDFKWRLPWVVKPGWIIDRLHDYMSENNPLRFSCGATPSLHPDFLRAAWMPCGFTNNVYTQIYFLKHEWIHAT